MQAGNALSSLLPDHVGKDDFKSNYSQAFIPGLVTSLRGIRYEPCLLRSSVLGAGVAAAGVVFNPELFATRPTGAGLLPHSSLHSVKAVLAACCGSHESRSPCYKHIPEDVLISIKTGRCRVLVCQDIPASHTVPLSTTCPVSTTAVDREPKCSPAKHRLFEGASPYMGA